MSLSGTLKSGNRFLNEGFETEGGGVDVVGELTQKKPLVQIGEKSHLQ